MLARKGQVFLNFWLMRSIPMRIWSCKEALPGHCSVGSKPSSRFWCRKANTGVTDMCTSLTLAPISRPDFWFFMGGVSRTLNISYLRAIPIGTTIRVNSMVVHAGRTMALLGGKITSVDGKTVYYTCEHHKVDVRAGKDHKAMFENMRLDKARLIAESDSKL
jgi:hypothetical protein